MPPRAATSPITATGTVFSDPHSSYRKLKNFLARRFETCHKARVVNQIKPTRGRFNILCQICNDDRQSSLFRASARGRKRSQRINWANSKGRDGLEMLWFPEGLDHRIRNDNDGPLAIGIQRPSRRSRHDAPVIMAATTGSGTEGASGRWRGASAPAAALNLPQCQILTPSLSTSGPFA
jgi:hypothetical protein